MDSEYIIEMLNIRKEFPGIVANDDITLQLKRGEIHALLGENGVLTSFLTGTESKIFSSQIRLMIWGPTFAFTIGSLEPRRSLGV